MRAAREEVVHADAAYPVLLPLVANIRLLHDGVFESRTDGGRGTQRRWSGGKQARVGWCRGPSHSHRCGTQSAVEQRERGNHRWREALVHAVPGADNGMVAAAEGEANARGPIIGIAAHACERLHAITDAEVGSNRGGNTPRVLHER